MNLDIVQEAKKFAQEEMEKFGMTEAPIFFEITEKKGLELAEKLNADKAIVLVGTYLKDVKIGEAFQERRLWEHIKMSVEATKEFLKKFDIDKSTEKKIINCVEAHHTQVPFICKEAEIVANADCYMFLAPKGFFVFLMKSPVIKDLKFSDALNFIEAKLDEKYKILSLDVCKKELEPYYHQFKKLFKSAREL
ncbi:MAG: hypothetical protein ISS87_01365 [Candidatus Pacebacteria bacterium]|nr:hypothetical protein [Candidatus Paceibacterota bacterium]